MLMDVGLLELMSGVGGRSVSLRSCVCHAMGLVRGGCLGESVCGQQCPLQGWLLSHQGKGQVYPCCGQ